MAIETYDDILKEILGDIDQKQPIEANDITLMKSIEKAKDPEYEKRNELYTSLLSQYIDTYCEKAKAKSFYKAWFFWIVMGAFILINALCLLSIVIISLKSDVTVQDLGIVISSSSGIFSSLIIIPKIIAEHLFPKDEDVNMIGMVKNMQLNDTGIRNVLNPVKGREE